MLGRAILLRCWLASPLPFILVVVVVPFFLALHNNEFPQLLPQSVSGFPLQCSIQDGRSFFVGRRKPHLHNVRITIVQWQSMLVTHIHGWTTRQQSSQFGLTIGCFDPFHEFGKLIVQQLLHNRLLVQCRLPLQRRVTLVFD